MPEADNDLRRYEPHEQPALLTLSYALRRFVDTVGKIGAWMAVPLVLITVLDVLIRKMVWKDSAGHIDGVQIWLVNNVSQYFGSTLLQELEWHFHTALFALVLGYGYIYNTHVRVDLIRENLSFRKKIWIEFIGLTMFTLPYCVIVAYFAYIYAYDSFMISEQSASTIGLTNRWIIKSVLVFGLVVAFSAALAVWLQMLLVIVGDPNRRFELMAVEWPEEAGTFIEGKRRLELTDDEPAPAPASAPPHQAAGQPAE